MKFSSILIAVATATISSASPVEKRAKGGVSPLSPILPPRMVSTRRQLTRGCLQVLMCTGPKATGTCKYAVYTMKDCHQLEKPYVSNINTFAPDGENFECFPRAYDCGDICTSPTGCTFGAVDFDYEHKYNLSAISWTKEFRSFDCMMKTASS